MPDTGAPWNIPYVESTDLVSDWPADSLALANAIDSGLDAASGLVAVKHALFTGTQTNSTAAGADFAVTDLSITHALSSASNKLIISAYLGAAASSYQRAEVGLAVADDGTPIGRGASAGNRTLTGSVGRVGSTSNITVLSPSVTFVYEPGDTASHTFTVRAINPREGTATIYINRTEDDSNLVNRPRASSGFVIQEVKA